MRPVMRSNPSSQKDSKPRRHWKLLLWATLASLVFGALQVGEVVEDVLRVARNTTHQHSASGDIVFVGIDDRSVRAVGEWPWPRSVQAKLVEQAQAAGAKHVFMDLVYEGTTSTAEDRAFAQALENSKGRMSVTLPVRERVGTRKGQPVDGEPIQMLQEHVKLASASVWYNYQNAVWKMPFTGTSNGRVHPSFSAAMAQVKGRAGENFRVDYSLDLNTIRTLSAGDLINGRVKPSILRGKTVIIGLNSWELGDLYWVPGRGQTAGALVLVAGAETLKGGRPLDLGWPPPLLLIATVAGFALLKLGGIQRTSALSVAALALLVLPTPLEAHLIFADIAPALFLLGVLGARLSYLRWRDRGLVNSGSGIPNMEALRSLPDVSGSTLIAVRVQNYAEIASTVKDDEDAELARQIVARLSAGGTANVFQGDEGVFAWLTETKGTVGNHLEALHALFRSPVIVGNQHLDVAVSFGVELGSARSIKNRLGSALVAADEAWNEGLKWKLHDPSRQEEVKWRLSLLGELDAAIDNGEVWLAYQPQLDLRRGVVIGAEALARWTHPKKGPISPNEFIAAAEAHGRIGKLTDFVLDRAVATASAINRRGVPFQIAVNLSARSLSDRQFVQRLQRVLQVHGLPPNKLTLELTETAALQDPDGGMALLDNIQRLGVRIAIDDYGTGLSTLDYLKKVPADEIKIDQSFVRAMRVNRSDLIMVQSTIALAGSLGRIVVAEGVEDQQCLDDLTAMGCDVAQGFAIGRPMGVRELVQRLHGATSRRVA
jgi:EAL domain-containing protein (putative c-di-GMP-specific phosphodiesterase class I)/CHASE2 domain-containing sensor protein